eukprot:COSAG05_NODE_2256_length_3329_cov_2.630031_2_plen_218_part_00
MLVGRGGVQLTHFGCGRVGERDYLAERRRRLQRRAARTSKHPREHAAALGTFALRIPWVPRALCRRGILVDNQPRILRGRVLCCAQKQNFRRCAVLRGYVHACRREHRVCSVPVPGKGSDSLVMSQVESASCAVCCSPSSRTMYRQAARLIRLMSSHVRRGLSLIRLMVLVPRYMYCKTSKRSIHELRYLMINKTKSTHASPMVDLSKGRLSETLYP